MARKRKCGGHWPRVERSVASSETRALTKKCQKRNKNGPNGSLFIALANALVASAMNTGGQSRNRTTDTRIFNP
jgi:hypothetical protein